MSHLNHGPYTSGSNLQLKFETLESLILQMTDDEFFQLQELMASDMGCSVDDPQVPQSPHDLLEQPTVSKRGIYAA